MQFISMDLICPFASSSNGHWYTLTVTFTLTGWYSLGTSKPKISTEVVQTFVDGIYAKFGGSVKILFNNSTEFKNQLFTYITIQLGAECKVYLPLYHSQSNGTIEVFHNIFKACMSKQTKFLNGIKCSFSLLCMQFLQNEHSNESPFFSCLVGILLCHWILS